MSTSGALVHIVIVIGQNRAHDHTHIFSTAEKAEDFADRCETPCVVSTYVIDDPERMTRGRPS